MGAGLSSASVPILIATSTAISSSVPLVASASVLLVVFMLAVSTSVVSTTILIIATILARAASRVATRIAATTSFASLVTSTRRRGPESWVVLVASCRVVVAPPPGAHAADLRAAGCNWHDVVANVQAMAVRAAGRFAAFSFVEERTYGQPFLRGFAVCPMELLLGLLPRRPRSPA